jgi:hypothetical protein
MRLDPSELPRIEAAHATLASLINAPDFEERFGMARLLACPAEVEAAREQLPAALLPFMRAEALPTADIYAFDLDDRQGDRVVVWNDHAAVADWSTFAAFVTWLRTLTGTRP